MNKTIKTTLLIIVVGLVTILGYFFTARKTNIFAQTPKVAAAITFQETGGGCGNIFVYRINKEDTVGISVFARKEKLNLSTTKKHLKLGRQMV